MKTIIEISGQPGGNTTLRLALGGIAMQTNWGGYELTYDSPEEAEADLKNAYDKLILDEPDYDGIIIREGDFLLYDASKAVIYKP